MAAGFYGGIVDELLMRLADLRLALPFVLLVISVIAVFGPSFTNLIVILGLTGWRCDLTIQRHCGFQGNQRRLVADVLGKALVQAAGLFRIQTDFDFDASGA